MNMFWKCLIVQIRIKKVLKAGRTPDETWPKLEELGNEFGVSIPSGLVPGKHEPILIERILAAARAHRDGIGWMIALVTAVAAFISASAALIAALR